jgi:hypothetical protein
MKTNVFNEFAPHRFGRLMGVVVRVLGKRVGNGVWMFGGVMYVFSDAFANEQRR